MTGFEFAITADWIDAKVEWSKKTFGEGPRPVGIVKHIESELQEILEKPSDVNEWCDVILLALDGASRQGHSGKAIVSALLAKHIKNVNREWPPPGAQDEPTFHIEEAK